jgi:tRNA(Ile)-lysidine synthase TilS/MesJ
MNKLNDKLLNDKLLNDLIETNLNALRSMYDNQVHTDFRDTDAEGNDINNSLQSVVYQLNGIIPTLYSQVTYADKMLSYAENGLKWEKDKMGASSRISNLDMYARSQEIAHTKLHALEKQFNAREHNFNHAYARMVAYTKYFKEITGDEYVPYTSKSTKYMPSEERQNKINTIKTKQKEKLKEFYNSTMGKLEKPLDNEDGTISSELIPAYV